MEWGHVVENKVAMYMQNNTSKMPETLYNINIQSRESCGSLQYNMQLPVHLHTKFI
jgi:hypothetical protein